MGAIAAFLATPAVGASAQPTPTVTSLVSQINPSVTGQSVTYTATVKTTPGGTFVTGIVLFSFVHSGGRHVHVTCESGGSTVTTTAGVASCTVPGGFLATTSPLTVTASFLGTSIDSGSTSAAVVQTVHPAPTTVAVTTSATRDVTLGGCKLVKTSATVTCSGYLGQAAVGALVMGAGLAAGTHVTSVADSGGSADLTITPVATETMTGASLIFTIDPNGTITSGRPVRYIAAVTAQAPGSGHPAGWVTWRINGADGSSVACANGTPVRLTRVQEATCTVSAGLLLRAGSPYSVVATYGGSPEFSTSSGSLAHTQTVTAASTKTYVAASPLPPKTDALFRITAAVEPSRFGTAPTGTVTFSFLLHKLTGSTVTPGLRCEGGTNTITVDPGGTTCILQTGLTLSGTYAVAATYSGAPGDATSGTCPVGDALAGSCPAGSTRSLKFTLK